MLVTDVILLSIMLAGLLRIRRDPPARSMCLPRLLWKQGVVWLAIATAAELPQVLFLYLNMSDSFNLLFLVPSMIAIIITASRMYRYLIQSASPSDIPVHLGKPDSPNFQITKGRKRFVVSVTKDSSVVHIPSNRLDVMVHRAHHHDGEYPMSQTDHYDSELYPSSDAKLTDEPHDLDDNIEDRDEEK